MAVDRIELFLLRLPYVHFFETSFGREYERTFLVIRAVEDGVAGYGEVVASERPLYSYETTTTAWHVLKDFFIPLLFDKRISDPETLHACLELYRGHPMARAGLELALWDLRAKKEGKPLRALYGGIRDEVEAGVSVGIQDTVAKLEERVGGFLSQGYLRVKVKIKPGWDVAVCGRLRETFPDILLQADANGAYGLDDTPHLMELDGIGLLMLEQPFPPYDLWDHRLLQEKMETPLCLDESITSATTARQALEMGSCRIINIKVGRVGGIVEARNIHDLCQKQGIPVWCGGMLESGIGRAHNLHLATLPNFRFPNDISATERYYTEDITEPPFCLTQNGTISVPDGPGIGVTLKEDRIHRALLKKEGFRP